ncbi:programmed cell death protein 2-like [Leptopilina heterotoma]|uniref:programmed cell death protein 2-like n=1 Tax=Leptopilina heterotoma TaxID=63436 RepID=UPI001CA7B9E2|nr:programmed cell death protein 2-like [Leptopilina heterotoma]
MAFDKRTKIYLGFEDEYVTDKNRSLVNFMTDKIGGKPDWHNDKTITSPQCRLCGLHQILALQIYAPLENSKYHRTLYIFACTNPNCWNHNESWTCLKVQSLDESTNSESMECGSLAIPPTTSWLPDEDDWGDTWNDNGPEENGNNMLQNDPNKFKFTRQNSSFEDDLNVDFSDLRVDDPNANSPTSVESPVGGGAVGKVDSLHATAEIEGEESEVVCIDTPTQPQCDLISLLQEVTPLPIHHSDSRNLLSFVEIFISMIEEYSHTEVPQHVRDLFLEYQQNDPDSLMSESSSADSKTTNDTGVEKYEKSIPKHGDEMFHELITRIQENPGQILRYSRNNSAPLLLYPMGGCVGRCRHCGEEMTFELQILPTIIQKLKIQSRSETKLNFQIEFGTVLVFTCVRSCWSPTDSYREEHVIVQAERL